ncbi:LLM class flavin-dependent oxidoreductase [Thermomonospora echinospora]|uniref:LLM class flavin-dependent oxidoreductase n=1 Tax=Thermomonospora echinospora TaxID=1992 RepID=UPI000CDF2885|nr:LLM class flavin-dependent oxidoreductase [Thermomonospora echinospora]
MSILDLVSIPEGATAADGIAASMEAARQADRLGYRRLWYAEHHNTAGLAASASSLLIGRAAAVTERIRVGAGGVMLPNHAPLMVAEQYGTLANMFGDRIDLGLGRAPGTDPMTAQALSRSSADPQSFANDIFDLQGWFGDRGTARSAPIFSAVSAGTNVPIWVLGSTVSGASIAGQLGLPFAVASHFAPEQVMEAIELYREVFNASAPTAQIGEPYVMAGFNVMMMPTEEEARRQWTTVQQMFLDVRRGRRRGLQPPVDPASVADSAFADSMLRFQAVGDPKAVVGTLEDFVGRTDVDELIVATYAYDPADRMKSFELLAENWF